MVGAALSQQYANHTPNVILPTSPPPNEDAGVRPRLGQRQHFISQYLGNFIIINNFFSMIKFNCSLVKDLKLHVNYESQM
jgi:hypothetical protein